MIRVSRPLPRLLTQALERQERTGVRFERERVYGRPPAERTRRRTLTPGDRAEPGCFAATSRSATGGGLISRSPADVAEADLGQLGHDAVDGDASLGSRGAGQLVDPSLDAVICRQAARVNFPSPTLKRRPEPAVNWTACAEVGPEEPSLLKQPVSFWSVCFFMLLKHDEGCPTSPDQAGP
jgi:hypothetical protein